LFALAMVTGMRHGESLALYWSDIDGTKNETRMTMDGHSKGGDNLVFVNQAGKIINWNNLVSRMFKSFCQKAKVTAATGNLFQPIEADTTAE
jgi:integrase